MPSAQALLQLLLLADVLGAKGPHDWRTILRLRLDQQDLDPAGAARLATGPGAGPSSGRGAATAAGTSLGPSPVDSEQSAGAPTRQADRSEQGRAAGNGTPAPAPQQQQQQQHRQGAAAAADADANATHPAGPSNGNAAAGAAAEAAAPPPRQHVTVAVVRRQYRRMAALLHPDKCGEPQAADAFKRLAAALERAVQELQGAAGTGEQEGTGTGRRRRRDDGEVGEGGGGGWAGSFH